MKTYELPTHVFLSYSREDETAVSSVRSMLDQSGIPYWVDTQNLLPGTPDWENVIRLAIQSAYCVVILCSPQARKSQFVRAELSVAQYYNISILPVWVKGDSWIDSVPMLLANTQHIDIRCNDYERAYFNLCLRLKTIVKSSKPKHAVIDGNLFGGYYENVRHQHFEQAYNFRDYITIFLVKASKEQKEDQVAVFDPEAYPSTQSLLDDLYIHYLENKTEPLSYGKEWLLIGSRQQAHGLNPRRIIAPWSYLEFIWQKELATYDIKWGELPPKEYDLVGGSIWDIQWKNDIRDAEPYRNYDQPIGLAINSDELLKAVMFGGGKQPAYLIRGGYLSRGEFQDINPRDYRHTLIVQNNFGQYNRIVKETNKVFDIKTYDYMKEVFG